MTWLLLVNFIGIHIKELPAVESIGCLLKDSYSFILGIHSYQVYPLKLFDV